MGVLHFLYFVLLSFTVSTPLDPTFVSSEYLSNKPLICEFTNYENPFNGSGDLNVCSFIRTWTFIYGNLESDLECSVTRTVPIKSLNKAFKFLKAESYNVSQYPVMIPEFCGKNCLYFSTHQGEFKVKTSFNFLTEAQVFRLNIKFVHNIDKFTIYNRPIYIVPNMRRLDGLSNHSCNRGLFPEEDKIDQFNEVKECYIKLAELSCTFEFLRNDGKKFFVETGFKPVL